MPLPLAALIGGGSQILGGGIDALATAGQNRKSRQFSREMYERQYNDNLNLWQLNNEYNDPQSQMKRLQKAGLNPNLIYGSSSGGAAGQSSAMRSPDVQTPQFKTPEFGRSLAGGGLSYMNAIYDLDIKKAQIDNLRAQNTQILEDTALKRVQQVLQRTNADRGKFQLEFDTEMRPYSGDLLRESVRQRKTTTDIAINEDARRAALTASSLKEAAQRFLNMQEQNLNLRQDRARSRAETARTYEDIKLIRQRINLAQKDGTLRDIEIGLRKDGINPSDPMWARLIGTVLTDFLQPDSTRSIWRTLFGN